MKPKNIDAKIDTNGSLRRGFELPGNMKPLLPTTGRGLLAELSAEIFRKSGELKSSLPSVTARAELAKRVGEMNRKPFRMPIRSG